MSRGAIEGVTLRRRAIRCLDRPGRRWLLAWLGSRYAKRLYGSDARVLYRGAWIHYLDGEYVVDGQIFGYYRETVAEWRERQKDARVAVADYWYQIYTPREGDVIVDVGAGIGVDTGVFSRSVGADGKVFAIEAHPGTFALLREAIVLNGWRNVTPIHCAIMEGPGTVHIAGPPADEGSTIQRSNSGSSSVDVPGTSLDLLCEQHGIAHIDLLKVNIEGAEQLAIRGMRETLARTKTVVIACHDFRAAESQFYVTRDVVTAFLTSCGFELLARMDDPRPYVRDHVHGFRPQSAPRFVTPRGFSRMTARCL